LDSGMGALPSGMRGTAVPLVLQHLTQVQLPTEKQGKKKVKLPFVTAELLLDLN